MRDREWCNTLGFPTRRPSLKDVRSLNDLNTIFYNLFRSLTLKGLKERVFIGKNPNRFGFERVLNQICMKNLGKINMTA